MINMTDQYCMTRITTDFQITAHWLAYHACLDNEAFVEKAISHQWNVINTWSPSNITQPRVKADRQWQGRKKTHHCKLLLYKVWRLKVGGHSAEADHFSLLLLLLEFKIRNHVSCVHFHICECSVAAEVCLVSVWVQMKDTARATVSVKQSGAGVRTVCRYLSERKMNRWEWKLKIADLSEYRAPEAY